MGLKQNNYTNIAPVLEVADLPVPKAIESASYQQNIPAAHESPYPLVNLFFAFDIVNSTQYKSMTKYWPMVIPELIAKIAKRVQNDNDLRDSQTWRIIGDEIIFTQPIFNASELNEAVAAVFRITQEVACSVRNGEFFSKLQTPPDENVTLLQPRNTLSVKASAWIGVINGKFESPYDNILHYYEAQPNTTNMIPDYLGRDIDTGFRIKQHTQDRRLCISLELAYFLLLNGQSAHLQIMDYVRLKGIWSEQLYPIIWYYNSDFNRDINRVPIPFEESFRYDEADNNPVVQRYFQRMASGELPQNCEQNGYLLKKEMYDAATAIPKIIADRNMEPKINHFNKYLRDTKGEKLPEAPCSRHQPESKGT